MEQIGDNSVELDGNLVRHMVLNSIRTSLVKHKHLYGPEVVIACDAKDSWRKEVFKLYKANRKKFRENSVHDWNKIFDVINMIKDELKQYSPYKVIEVDRCEADDVIATLVHEYHSTVSSFLIISSDKDFAQLQKYSNVYQYSPTQKKEIRVENPEEHLKTLIIKGDAGDGIPNILSVDNSLVDGIRQKSVTKVMLENWLSKEPEAFCNTPEMIERYHRNQKLIDLSLIPQEYYQNIIGKYQETKPNPKMKFMNYMVKYKLSNLIESLGDF